LIADFSKDGALGLLTLDSPPSNSLASPVFTDRKELAAFLADPALKGVIVTGRGRHFCGGADRVALESAMEDPDRLAADLAKGKELLDIISFALVPVVAAIRGQCLGGGLEIALACHFRIAAGSALFGFPEATMGLLPGLGGTQANPGRMRRQALIDLVLSGRMVGADEALEMGLVDRVVAKSKVEDAARERIDELTGRRPAAVVRAIMESIHNARRMDRDAALKRETILFRELVKRKS